LPHTLAHNPIGTPFIELQSVDSTNNYARSLIQNGLAQHGMVIFAHEQLEGKGQRARSWNTEKGANIILSILIKPGRLQVSEQFHLIACTALACYEFFDKYAGEDTRIKWPNDLYWQDRKAGGILIENIVGSEQPGIWQWAVVGIGININQTLFPLEIQNPVSLKQITGKDFDVVSIAKELCGIFAKHFEHLIKDGFDRIYSDYNNLQYKRNQLVKLKKDNRIFEAMIKGVSKNGQLMTEHAFEEAFEFGGIEWVIDKVIPKT
jgi:BirA family transcriptional regulator, biotin operon repressor / biotin---[acetyl-CoA-carboxylase] ligase